MNLSNNSLFNVGFSNQKSKKVFLFYKEPDNINIKSRLGELYSLSYIAYKSISDFKRLIESYNNYSVIVIANGGDIEPIEDIVSKKKGLIYIIRFKPPGDMRDNPRVKGLLSTYS